MTKFSKLKILFLSSILIFLSSAISAKAARLYFDPSSGNFSPGVPISVDLKIDTENQSINSIEGHLNFSSDIFSIEKLSNGGSIISFWVVPAKSENGEITFAGVIPGGYQGQSGLLLKIFLKPKKEGKGEINIKANSIVLLNDGQGTQASLTIYNSQFLISKQAPSSKPQAPSSKDTEPPESFIPQIGRESDIFNNQWFLVFATQDKNSGLDYYEMKEVRHFRFWELGFWKKQPEISWQKSESPYLLSDQSLKSDIFVKAVDKSGNKMIVMLPAQLKPWRELLVDIAIGLIVLIVILLVRRIWKKNTKYHE